MAHKSCAMQVRAMAEATAARSALVAPPLTSPLAKASTANTVKEGAIRPQGAGPRLSPMAAVESHLPQVTLLFSGLTWLGAHKVP